MRFLFSELENRCKDSKNNLNMQILFEKKANFM